MQEAGTIACEEITVIFSSSKHKHRSKLTSKNMKPDLLMDSQKRGMNISKNTEYPLH